MQEIVPNISRPKIFVNRELSWMEFNLRVLSESLNPKIPLMERLKFLSIYFSNLDEFFMVRVGSLHDQSIVEPDKLDDKTGLNAADQIDAILNKANQINPIAQKAWESICLELRNQDIDILDLRHLSKLDEQIVQKYFSEEMRPLLSPQCWKARMKISVLALFLSLSSHLISFLISISAEKFCLPLTFSCILLRSCLGNRRFRKSMSCV